jgi:hypothetical protein
MKSKKAQLKIQEMAFVLLAVIFLFGIILLFFTAFQSRQTAAYAEYLRDAKTITSLEVIASMPEFRCSASSGSTSESVCLDEDKVNAFSKNNALKAEYGLLWNNAFLSKIEIIEVYPNLNAIPYVIYSKDTEGSTRIYSTYSALCGIENQETRCKIAKIKATVIMPDTK